MARGFTLVSVVAAVGCGGPPAPPAEPNSADHNTAALAALRGDREAFEAAARGDRSEAIMRRRRLQGVLVVCEVGRCTEFHWPFTHVLDSIPVIYYASGGRADLPDRFWDGSSYLHPMEVDPHWFAAQRP